MANPHKIEIWMVFGRLRANNGFLLGAGKLDLNFGLRIVRLSNVSLVEYSETGIIRVADVSLVERYARLGSGLFRLSNVSGCGCFVTRKCRTATLRTFGVGRWWNVRILVTISKCWEELGYA